MKLKSVILFTLLAYANTQTTSTPEVTTPNETATSNDTTQSSLPPLTHSTTDTANVSSADSLIPSNSSLIEDDSQLYIMVINTFDKVPAPIRYWVITFTQTLVSAIITILLMRIKLIRNYVLEPYFTAIRIMSNLDARKQYEMSHLIH